VLIVLGHHMTLLPPKQMPQFVHSKFGFELETKNAVRRFLFAILNNLISRLIAILTPKFIYRCLRGKLCYLSELLHFTRAGEQF